MTINKQHTHQSYPSNPKKFNITVVCDHLSSPANVGSVFRLCDAFGILSLVFIGTEPDLSSTRLKRTARATLECTPTSYFETFNAYMASLDPDKINLIALEHTHNSIPLEQLDLNPPGDLILVIGNERTGVSSLVLEQVSHTVHINMFGENSSMNVAQATAIALYGLTQKLLS